MQDPLIKKRKAAEAAEAQGEDKKPRIEVPIADQIVLKAAPYANKSYDEQLEIKKNDMVKALTNLTREIKKLNYQIKPYIRAQEAVNSGLICPFLGVIPSPVHEKYRNKCDFTIGNARSFKLTPTELYTLIFFYRCKSGNRATDCWLSCQHLQGWFVCSRTYFSSAVYSRRYEKCCPAV